MVNKTKESFKYVLDNIIKSDLDVTSEFLGIHSFVFQAKEISKDYEGLSDNIAIVDSSFFLDDLFFLFCKEKGYKISHFKMDFSIVSSDSECDSYDPFAIYGRVLIEVSPKFKFLKVSTLNEEHDDEIVSVIVLAPNDYEHYVKFKSEYFTWLRNKKEITVNVVGGEDYVITQKYSWDSLFFGDKKELKCDVENFIQTFLNNKDKYIDANLQWKTNIIITGSSGSGKTELINTIISNFNLEPITINKYNIEDQILDIIFNAITAKSKILFILDDLDELLEEQLISVENVIKLLNNCKTNNGLIVIAAVKKEQKLLSSIYFDKTVKIDKPDYTKCINTLFSKYLTKKYLDQLIKLVSKNNFSYAYIYKLYENFAKRTINEDIDRRKGRDYFSEISDILNSLNNENKIVNKKTNTSETTMGLIHPQKNKGV